ncbi:RBBP9/YdeN family alpha/beta hydrolase [Sulfurospirillum sp. 1612]|uniref:RBBP9/YdeN family alpha/beta hydrolase n=1 Tax=Sulfurospirillum sp. 1612 TaxID=3094835 RepID=UPI002F9538EF
MKTLILHGWGGSDMPHWQSWLAGELAKDYGTVCFPLLKDKDAPIKEVWMQQVKALLDDFKPDTVVCHSLANTLWFHLCQAYDLPEVHKLFLVAPPSLKVTIQEVATFFPVEVPRNLHASDVVLITSTTDPYMSQDEANDLAHQLGVTHKILDQAGHINADSGFGVWDDILDMIKRDD